MGNVPGSTADISDEKESGGGSSKRRSKKSDGDDTDTDDDNNTNRNTDKHNNNDGNTRTQKTLGFSFRDWQLGLASGVRKLEEQDHPAAALIDSVCGPYLDRNDIRSTNSHDDIKSGKSSSRRNAREVRSFYSEDVESEDDSRTVSEDETTTATDYNKRNKKSRSSNRRRDERRSGRNGNKNDDKDEETAESASCMSQSDYESTVDDFARRKGKGAAARKKGSDQVRSGGRTHESSYETEDDDETEAVSTVVNEKTNSGGGRNNNNSNTNDAAKAFSSGSDPSTVLTKQPLASSFAKRCYFTKQGIGGTSQHYEGLTLTGNIVLMLAAAMKLKGCPTICDEDLRRVEQTYPNQFSRLPDELLLSSGWRRISKYCHFSFKPIPDGVPFFHSKQRLHSNGGYYFLLASSVGMVRPIDVEPLTRDTLVLLETDFPTQCDAAPKCLVGDPEEWTLVDRFCFFSGGPINCDEDVYYQADFDGNPIYMLAFLSPSLTPTELYKLNALDDNNGPVLKSISAVEDVESVYDLTVRDFDDLKLYHLGPCRALPQYILQPQAWTKVLPPHFLAQKDEALRRVIDYQEKHGIAVEPSEVSIAFHHQQLMSPNSRGFSDTFHGQHHTTQHPSGYFIQQQHAPPYTPSAASNSMAMQHMSHVNAIMHQQGLPMHSIPPPVGRFDQYHQLPVGIPPDHIPNEMLQPHIGGEMVDMYYEQNGNKQVYYNPMNYHSREGYEAINPQNQYHPMDEGHHQHGLSTAPYDQVSYADEYENPNQEQYNMHYHQPGQEMGHFTNQDGRQHQMIHQEDIYNQEYHLDSPYRNDPRINPNGSMFDSAYRGSWEGSPPSAAGSEDVHKVFQRDVEEDGAFVNSNVPIDEAIASHAAQTTTNIGFQTLRSPKSQVDPPEDEPPSLSKYKQLHPAGMHANSILPTSTYSVHSTEGSKQTSYQDDDCYSSQDKASRYSDQYKSENNFEQNEYAGEYDYYSQQESDTPVSEPRYPLRQESPLQQIASREIYTLADVEVDDTVSQGEENDVIQSPSSNYSIPISDGEFATQDLDTPTDSGSNLYPSPTGTDLGNRSQGLPPYSPRSTAGSELSQSSALRGAQELLRRNRARRMSARKEREEDGRCGVRDGEPSEVEDPSTPFSVNSQEGFESGGTWEGTSEMTSVVSGSSVWTDSETNPDRNSRRALILQMAKARMRSNKSASGTTPTSVQSRTDISHSISDTDSPKHQQQPSLNQHHLLQYDEEEKKFDYRDGGGTEINLCGDLD